MLFQLLIVCIEITKLIRKNVSVRDKVEVGFAEFFLHSDHIIAKTVLPGNLIALREVIDFLVLVEAFI